MNCEFSRSLTPLELFISLSIIRNQRCSIDDKLDKHMDIAQTWQIRTKMLFMNERRQCRRSKPDYNNKFIGTQSVNFQHTKNRLLTIAHSFLL